MISRVVLLLLGYALCSGPLEGLAELIKYAPLFNSSLLGSSLMLSGKGLNELGQYDRCLKEGHRYYYLSYLLPDLQAQVGLGVCLPQEIDEPALSSALHSVASPLLGSSRSQFIKVVDSQHRHVHTSVVLYLFLVVVGLLVMLSVGAVAKGHSEEWLGCFHPLDNLKRLPQVPQRRQGLSLEFLDGVRAIASLVVILGHTYFARGVNAQDMATIREFAQTLPFSILMGGLYSVDMFFLLSGFLVALSVGGRGLSHPWGLLQACLMRYLRLMPLYVFLMMGFYQVLPYLGSGPRWPQLIDMTNACSNMWRNVLLIDNWFPVDQSYCFGWGWYMSNDYQMFLIALLPMGLLQKRPRTAKAILTWLVISNLTIQLVSNLTNHSTLYFYGLPNDTTPHSRSIYFRLPYRWGVYFIGVLFGVHYLHLSDYLRRHSICILTYSGLAPDQPFLLSLLVRIRDTRIYRCVFYGLGLAIILTLVTIKDDFVQRHGNWPIAVQQLLNVTERPLFGIGLLLCLLPLFLQTSHILAPLLSMYSLRLLAKLSYAMYLSHFIVIMYGLCSARQNVFFRHLDLLSLFYADALITIVLSAVLHVLVETPFLRLLQLLLHRSTPTTQPHQITQLLLESAPKPNTVSV